MVKRRKDNNSSKKGKITKENVRMEAEALEKSGAGIRIQEATRGGSESSVTDPRLAAEMWFGSKRPVHYSGRFAGVEYYYATGTQREAETRRPKAAHSSGNLDGGKRAVTQPIVNAHDIIPKRTVCALETLENSMNNMEEKVNMMITRSTSGRATTSDGPKGQKATRVTRKMSRIRAESGKQRNDQDEEDVIVHEPVVVDLDSDDLKRYVENKVSSVRGEPAVTDINRDINEYIDRKIEEKLEEKLSLILDERTVKKKGLDDEQRKMILATLNSKQMVCECCPEGNHRASRATLTWHTETQTWSDDHGPIEPMTSLKAWATARKMVVKIRSGNDPNNTWYKCIMCGEHDNNLVDIHYGQDQLKNHINKSHRTTLSIYRDICNNNIGWVERQVTGRFQNIIRNVHRQDYDNQLRKIRGGHGIV